MSQTPNQKNILQNNTITANTVTVGDSFTYIIEDKPVTFPCRLTNYIPSDAAHIIGRDAELRETYKQLHNGNPTVLVNGVGGIGKSSVATKYIVTHADYYAHRAWLTVNKTVQDAFIGDDTLLRSLHIEKDVQGMIAGQQMDAAFNHVFKSLNDLNDKGRTLVVLDNANDAADLVAFQKLFKTAHAHFLITSRNKPEGWKIVPIKPLPEDEAVDLFRKHYFFSPDPKGETILSAAISPARAVSPPGSGEKIKSLLKTLFYHTLLIELVAKSAAASAIPFTELTRRLQTAFIHDTELNKRRIDMGAHGNSLDDNAKRAKVEDYILFIFENITDLSDDLQNILRGMVLLPLAEAFDENFVADFVSLWSLETDIFDNLDLLSIRGWLEKEQIGGEKATFKLHPLIADVVRKHLNVDAAFANPYIKKIADLINYNPQNPKHNLFDINKNKPFADRLSDLFFSENTEGGAYLLDRLGYIEENFGFYHKAAKYGERALDIAESIFDKNHKTIAVRQSNLANVYSALGRYDRAAELLETALASAETNFGKDHPNVAVSQSNLANVYSALGRYDRAAELLETALASDLTNFGKDHPNVAVSQNNLAFVYYSVGRRAEAKALWQAAYQNFLKNLGATHPHTIQLKEYAEMGE